MTFAGGVRGFTLAVAAAVTVAGVLILTGVLDRAGMAPPMRISIGVVATLYGVYKFVVTWFRRTGNQT
jgi:hypothetical protein